MNHLLLVIVSFLVLTWFVEGAEVKLNTPYTLVLSNQTLSKYKLIQLSIQPNGYGFVVNQLHSQHKAVVTSFLKKSSYGNEYNSTNSGLVKMLQDQEFISRTYLGVASNNFVNAVFFSIPAIKFSPVPGACCLTCSLEINPNIKVTYQSFKTTVQFERASAYWRYPKGYPQCDDKVVPRTFSLVYDIYYYFLNENDLSEKGLFDGLWKMATPDNIKENGKHLTTIKGAEILSAATEKLFAQGVIFNVIVTDSSTGYSAAYVPAATYGCNFTSTDNECQSKGSAVSLTYSIIFSLLGIVMCFAGFKLFRILLFLSGMVFFWLIIYTILARYSVEWESDELLIVSSMCSLVGGAIVLFLYAFRKVFYLCILNVCLSFGMFIAAVMFYTPFGYYEFWNEYYRFLLGYVCVTMFIATIFLFFPKVVCYLFSSLLGSYAVILLPNYFLRSNMHYIVVTVLLRMTVKDFGSSYLRRPYQQPEYILTGAWAALFLIGFIVQYFTSRNDEFEVSGKEIRRKAWEKFSESVHLSRRGRRKKKKKQTYYTPESDERTPLIINGTNDQMTFSSFGHTRNVDQPDVTDDVAFPLQSPDLLESTPLLHKSAAQNYTEPTTPPRGDERYPRFAYA